MCLAVDFMLFLLLSTLVLPVIQLCKHIYWALTRNAKQCLKVKWIEISLLMDM